MLKPYSELRKIDVTKYCDFRKAKDDNGKPIDVPYLNWAKCKDLLHDNGAEKVYFTPLKTPEGSYLFSSKEVQNKDGRTTGCYFVSVEVVIDDLKFTMDAPLLNGTIVVYDDTLNQTRIANAHARAFVKGVAIHTGLGFGLWSTDETPNDDLSAHSMLSIKRRVEELATIKLQNVAYDDILSALGIKDRDFKMFMGMYERLNNFEKALAKV